MILQADARRIPLADGSVHMCVTSPPYWGLRDYGVSGQLGLEPTPDEYVANMVQVFREVRRVLRDDGTLWLNLGDSYMSQPSWGRDNGTSSLEGRKHSEVPQALKDQLGRHPRGQQQGIKPKDLVGIPWMVAFALRADGWYLRSDIIWSKPNPMPESVTDRPTKAHEYLFLLSKQPRYYYDAEAVKEPAQVWEGQAGRFERSGAVSEHVIPGQSAAQHRPSRNGKNAFRGQGSNRDAENGHANRDGREMADVGAGAYRNRRSVWTVATAPFKMSGTTDDWANYDYVGPGGKPYRASPDCPVHGHLYHARTSGTPEYDARLAELSSRNPGNGVHPAPSQVSLLDAMTSHTSPGADDASVHLQTHESKGGSRTSVDHLAPTLDERKTLNTSRTLVDGGPTPDSQGLPGLQYSETAKPRSKRSRKTARADQTSERDTASAQMTDHTPGTSLLPAHNGHGDHTPANNSGVGASPDEPVTDPSAGMPYRIERIESLSFADCTCKPAKTQVDHFATFPPALVEPCILAGTSARGVCSACGAPWARVVEREFIGDSGNRNKPYGKGLVGGSARTRHSGSHLVAQKETTGWSPTCTCDAPTVPAIVLDPFAGSGTTGAVARLHGRRFVGLDINGRYLKELALPRAEGKTSAAALAELPLFAP